MQERYLAKDYVGAMAAVPLEFLDATSLLGPMERIAERMAAFAEAGVTTLSLAPFVEPAKGTDVLRTAVEALERSGAA